MVHAGITFKFVPSTFTWCDDVDIGHPGPWTITFQAKGRVALTLEDTVLEGLSLPHPALQDVCPSQPGPLIHVAGASILSIHNSRFLNIQGLSGPVVLISGDLAPLYRKAPFFHYGLSVSNLTCSGVRRSYPGTLGPELHGPYTSGACIGVLSEEVVMVLPSEIVDSTFSNNSAVSGGAVGLTAVAGRLRISSTTFSNNSALHNGGALLIQRITGGNQLVGDVSIDGATWYSNSAGHCGGALAVGTINGDVRVTGSSFISNQAAASGGAICVEALVNSSASATDDSSAEKGTGAYTCGRFVMDGDELRSNTAGQHGGALAVTQVSGEIHARNSSFTFNKADAKGGAMAIGSLLSGTVELDSIMVHDNAAVNGGFMAFDLVAGQVAITGASRIHNNVAQFGGLLAGPIQGCGGLLYVNKDISATGRVRLDRSMLHTHSAALNGGLVAVVGSLDGSVIFTDVSVEDAAATLHGGLMYVGIASAPGSVVLQGSVITKVSAGGYGGLLSTNTRSGQAIRLLWSVLSTAISHVYAAQGGGGLHLGSDYAASLLVSNSSSILNVSTAGSGGWAHVSGALTKGATITVEGSSFEGLSAAYNGGLLSVGSHLNGTLTITAAATVQGVLSGLHGGLLSLQGDLHGEVVIEKGSSVHLSEAAVYGGVMHIAGSLRGTLRVHSKSTLHGLKAALGGAFYVGGDISGQLVVDSESHIFNTTASPVSNTIAAKSSGFIGTQGLGTFAGSAGCTSGCGGAVYVRGGLLQPLSTSAAAVTSAMVLLRGGSEMSMARALEHGGAIYIGGDVNRGTALVIDDASSLSMCSAGLSGGGIHVSGQLAGSISLSSGSKLRSCAAEGGAEHGGGGMSIAKVAQSGVLHLSESSIAGCRAPQGRGAGVLVTADVLTGARIRFTRCNMTDNNAAVGGVLAFGGQVAGAVLVEGAVARNNRATYGGVVAVGGILTGSIRFSTAALLNNTADISGGVGLFANTISGPITFENVQAVGNTAGANGGVLQLEYSLEGTRLLLSNVTMTSNTAAERGGVIMATQVAASASVVIANGSILAGNYAGVEGGAIKAVQLLGNVTVADSCFSGNAAGSGGSIHVDAVGSSSIVSMHSSTFVSSTAKRNGGVLAVVTLKGAITLHDSNFSSCTAVGEGGGVLHVVDISGRLQMERCTFGPGNSAQTFGGSVFVSSPSAQRDAAAIVVLSCTFLAGTAKGFGGGAIAVVPAASYESLHLPAGAALGNRQRQHVQVSPAATAC